MNNDGWNNNPSWNYGETAAPVNPTPSNPWDVLNEDAIALALA
jgi:hypothetical protein